MNKRLTTSLATILVSCVATQADAQTECQGTQLLMAKKCVGDGMEPKEMKIYELINLYRAQFGLPTILQSPSLTLVANRHVRDLDGNLGVVMNGWSSCVYDTRNHSTWDCMWKAPQRLGTPYPGNGYEITQASGYKITANSAVDEWQRGSYSNSMLLNPTWHALGIGTYKNYVVLWFGNESDPLPPVEIPKLPDLGYGQTIDDGHVLPSLAMFRGGALGLPQGRTGGQNKFENTATVTTKDQVSLRGTLLVDSAHVGKIADIVVYAVFTHPTTNEQAFYMMDDNAVIAPWNQKISELTPFTKKVTLQRVYDLELYEGQFATPGSFKVFFGYRLPQNILVANKQPIEFTVK